MLGITLTCVRQAIIIPSSQASRHMTTWDSEIKRTHDASLCWEQLFNAVELDAGCNGYYQVPLWLHMRSKRSYHVPDVNWLYLRNKVKFTSALMCDRHVIDL